MGDSQCNVESFILRNDSPKGIEVYAVKLKPFNRQSFNRTKNTRICLIRNPSDKAIPLSKSQHIAQIRQVPQTFQILHLCRLQSKRHYQKLRLTTSDNVLIEPCWLKFLAEFSRNGVEKMTHLQQYQKSELSHLHSLHQSVFLDNLSDKVKPKLCLSTEVLRNIIKDDYEKKWCKCVALQNSCFDNQRNLYHHQVVTVQRCCIFI